MKKRNGRAVHDCRTCEYCEYVGEGGCLCTVNNEIVVEDWEETEEYYSCEGMDYSSDGTY